MALPGAPMPGHILLTTAEGDSTLGDEGYELTVSPQDVTLAAYQPAGLPSGGSSREPVAGGPPVSTLTTPGLLPGCCCSFRETFARISC